MSKLKSSILGCVFGFSTNLVVFLIGAGLAFSSLGWDPHMSEKGKHHKLEPGAGFANSASMSSLMLLGFQCDPNLLTGKPSLPTKNFAKFQPISAPSVPFFKNWKNGSVSGPLTWILANKSKFNPFCFFHSTSSSLERASCLKSLVGKARMAKPLSANSACKSFSSSLFLAVLPQRLALFTTNNTLPTYFLRGTSSPERDFTT